MGLLEVFMVVHDAASMTFGQGGGKDGRKAKELADLCRTIVAQVALASNKPVTEVMGDICRGALRILISYLDLSFGSRTAIAYVACRIVPVVARKHFDAVLNRHSFLSLTRFPRTLRCRNIAQQRPTVLEPFSLPVAWRSKAKQAVYPPSSLASYCGSAIDKLSGC
jgi:hypothetical protein